ncbi:MAG TPA: hypothetical protein VFX43_07210 [Chitinophagaceae bacterium]|jgi:uncharacterized membrane protein YeaQ/YmgE (transglycosylase-associated protein family)|nr:hypothetical protein [Chitinophagaceae bacterium]
MTLGGFIVLLIIAAICGSIGQAIAGYSLGGCLVSIVVGFIGALIGEWLSVKFALPAIFVIHIQGEAFPVIWAIIGAVIFTIIIGVIRKGLRNT